jgi:hypothetical protein
MADKFNSDPTIVGPGVSAVAVTPSDAADLAYTTRMLYIGGAGNLTVKMADGVNCTFTAVPAGSTLPLRVTRVLATGTTATSIVAVS